MAIHLSVKQRLELQALVRTTCRGKKMDPKRRQGKTILAKFKIPAEEMALYETEIPGAGAFRNSGAIARAPELEVSFTRDDAMFLESLIADGFTNLGPDDDEWLEPLEAALAAVGADVKGGSA